MKKIGLLIVLLTSLIACSSDSDEKANRSEIDYFGKWIHKENSKTWNMSYQFNKNNTVVKTLINENGTRTITGTFVVTKTSLVTSFELTYPQKDVLISNCNGSLKENLIIDDSGNLNDAAAMCDRYGIYKKSK